MMEGSACRCSSAIHLRALRSEVWKFARGLVGGGEKGDERWRLGHRLLWPLEHFYNT